MYQYGTAEKLQAYWRVRLDSEWSCFKPFPCSAKLHLSWFFRTTFVDLSPPSGLSPDLQVQLGLGFWVEAEREARSKAVVSGAERCKVAVWVRHAGETFRGMIHSSGFSQTFIYLLNQVPAIPSTQGAISTPYGV
jgi:hypothetical protein